MQNMEEFFLLMWVFVAPLLVYGGALLGVLYVLTREQNEGLKTIHAFLSPLTGTVFVMGLLLLWVQESYTMAGKIGLTADWVVMIVAGLLSGKKWNKGWQRATHYLLGLVAAFGFWYFTYNYPVQ
jgi:hypothetical protein